jgi:hypothetical protein
VPFWRLASLSHFPQALTPITATFAVTW